MNNEEKCRVIFLGFWYLGGRNSAPDHQLRNSTPADANNCLFYDIVFSRLIYRSFFV